MDDPRRRPPPFPSLAVRERGNYISVRERPDSQGGRGTLNRPKPIEMPRLGQQVLHTRLGYEATPSTEVWSFEVPYALQLQVNRRSEDRAANCVAVALLDAGNRHVAPLVATARGVGLPVAVPAGSYRIIASLGIPEEVAVEIEVNAAPPIGLAGALLGTAGGSALLLSTSRRSLVGSAVAEGGGRGRLVIGGKVLVGAAIAGAGGTLLLRLQAPRGGDDRGGVVLDGGAAGTAFSAGDGVDGGAASSLQPPDRVFNGGHAWMAMVGRSRQALVATGRLDATPPAYLEGMAPLRAGGRMAIPPVVWRRDPDNFWRARRAGGVLELNAVYFSRDPALQRQQLAEAGL